MKPTKENIEELLIHFLDDMRDYQRESNNNVGFDERTSKEFIDIYLEHNYYLGHFQEDKTVSDEEIDKIRKMEDLYKVEYEKELTLQTLQSYYCKIQLDNLSTDTILDMMEKDMQSLKLNADKLKNNQSD